MLGKLMSSILGVGQWIRVGALSVAALAAAALIGWISGIPSLASFGGGRIPMAPSTAVLFALMAAAILVHVREALSPGGRRVVLALTLTVGVSASILLVLSSLGIQLDAEHAGFQIRDAVGRAPTGHMSPLTGLCFLLASLSFIVQPVARESRFRSLAGWWLAAGVTAAGLLLLIAYLYGKPLLYGSVFIPPAATTSLAFLLLGSTLLGMASSHPLLGVGEKIRRTRALGALVVLFVVLAAIIIASGYYFFRRAEREFRLQASRQLESVADLKVSELAQWRRERLSDGDVFHGNWSFSALTEKLITAPRDPVARAHMLAWMSQVKSAYQYAGLSLFDADRRLLASVPEAPESQRGGQLGEELSKALLTGETCLVDFYRETADSPVRLATAIPIFEGPAHTEAIGVLVMHIDPSSYLYGTFRRWPTPTETAETLVVRREGNKVVFLNALRFDSDAAMHRRFALDEATLPAAMVVRGKEGIVEGRDYRGKPVLACLRAVPDSPWYLVAKMDLSELYEPLQGQLLALIAFVGCLIVLTAASLGLLYRRQSALRYKVRYEAAEALRKQEEQYRHKLDNMLEGCQIIGRDWRYLYLNDVSAQHAQRPKEELLGRKLMDCFPDIADTAMFAALRRCMEERVAHRMETEIFYPDGSTAWFKLSMQPVPEGVFVIGIDITQRKQNEERLAHLTRVLQALRNVNQLITHEKDRVKLVDQACELLTETRGYRTAWLGLTDADGKVTITAESGIGSETFASLCTRLERGEWPPCCRKAFASSEVVLVHDPASECSECPLKLARTDSAALAMHLSHAGRDYGVLVVELPKLLANDVEEQSLFEELCGDIGFALYAIEMEGVRERVEQELRQHHEMLEQIIEGAAEAIFVKDAEGRYRVINSTGARMLGYPAEGVLGRTDAELLPAETARQFRITDEAVMARGENLIREEAGLIAGEIHTFRAHKAPWLDNSGRILGVIGVSADVTARNKMEDELRQSEARYRALIESAPDAIVVYSAGEIVFANSAAVTMCDLESVEQLRQIPLIELVHPDERADVAERLRQDFDADQHPVRETMLLRPDGTEVAVETVACMIDFQGETALQFFVRDISKRKKAEEELRKLTLAVEQNPASVVITDIDGAIEYVNPKFTEVTHYTLGEVQGQNLSILKSGETPQSVYEDLWRTIRAGGEWRGELHNKKKDGTLFWERIYITPIRTADGVTTHYLGIKEDITQQKVLEEQYRQAQKMEAVGRLAGGVAHDFNNILQTMMGYSQMLLDELDEDTDVHGFANEIATGTERAASLTRQLLAFSRRQVLKLEDLDLNNVIEDLVKMLGRLIGEDVRLEFVPGHRLGTVHADRGQMEQILLNLAVNARDAMPEGGTLTIETENVTLDSSYCQTHTWAHPGRYVLLSVTDTGCGIDDETLSQVFEPFFTTKDMGEGTGLGLATVHGIVTQHNGMIIAYSEVDKGTTFKIYLPVIERPASHVGPKVVKRAAGGTETIMLIEDDENVRIMAQRVLEFAGYTVITAVNGRDALRVYREQGDRVDLMLVDVVMPEMGGRAVYDELKKVRPELKFLFSSGYSTNAIHTNFVLEQGIEFIQKPYAPDALLRKLRDVLDNHQEAPKHEQDQS